MAWVNPLYGSRDMTTYSRFDPKGGRGIGIPNIKNETQGAGIFAKYQELKPGEKGYENAQNYLRMLKRNTGLDDWRKATPEQLTFAIDDWESEKQKDNQKTNKFGDSLIGKILSVAAPAAISLIPGFQGWGGALAKGALAGAAGGGIRGGNLSSALKGAGIGAVTAGALKGASNLYKGQSFTGNAAPIVDHGVPYDPGAASVGNGLASAPVYRGGQLAIPGVASAALGAAGNTVQALGNQVPGSRTGVTTPTGGGISTQQGSGRGAPIVDKGVPYSGAAAGAGGSAAANAAANAAGSAGSGLLGKLSTIAPIVGAAVPVVDALTAGGAGGPSQSDFDALEAQRERDRLAAIEKANASFGDQSGVYDRIRNSIVGYHSDRLNKQQADEARLGKFALARGAQLGSSNEIDFNRELQDSVNEGNLSIVNLADSAVLDAKSRDESARLSAIRDINAGVDSDTAITGALNQINTNAENAEAFGTGSDIGNVFSDIALLYDQGRRSRAQGEAITAYNSARPKGSAGRSVRPANSSSSSSGRVVNF